MIDFTLMTFSYILKVAFYYTYFYITASLTNEKLIVNKFKIYSLFISIIMVVVEILLKNIFPLNIIAILLISFISVSVMYRISILKAIFISILLLILQSIIKILVMLIFMSTLNIKSIQLLNTFHIDSFKNILHSLICICLLLILKKITGRKSNLQNFKLMLTKNHIKSFLLIILLAILPQIILIIMNNYNYAPIFLALNFMQLLGISLFVFWYILNFLEKENLKIQNQTLEMDNKTLGGMVDGVRTIKHDFNNIFQAINGYICSKEYDDLEKYVLKVMKECNFVNTLSIINKNTFNDPAIYGVVGSKYFLATETGITMELDVTVNFKELEFPMPELSRILGILLDNAIEAASKSIDKYIRLEIKFNPRKNANIIKIYNTYDTNINIDLSSIYKKGYSSKKIKSGLGLWEVSKIISRNKNSQIYATIENNKFIQNIIIEICN